MLTESSLNEAQKYSKNVTDLRAMLSVYTEGTQAEGEAGRDGDLQGHSVSTGGHTAEVL